MPLGHLRSSPRIVSFRQSVAGWPPKKLQRERQHQQREDRGRGDDTAAHRASAALSPFIKGSLQLDLTSLSQLHGPPRGRGAIERRRCTHMHPGLVPHCWCSDRTGTREPLDPRQLSVVHTPAVDSREGQVGEQLGRYRPCLALDHHPVLAPSDILRDRCAAVKHLNACAVRGKPIGIDGHEQGGGESVGNLVCPWPILSIHVK